MIIVCLFPALIHPLGLIIFFLFQFTDSCLEKWIPLQLALKAGSALEPENPYLLREIFLFLLDIANGVMEDKWARFIDTTLFSVI